MSRRLGPLSSVMAIVLMVLAVPFSSGAQPFSVSTVVLMLPGEAQFTNMVEDDPIHFMGIAYNYDPYYLDSKASMSVIIAGTQYDSPVVTVAYEQQAELTVTVPVTQAIINACINNSIAVEVRGSIEDGEDTSMYLNLFCSISSSTPVVTPVSIPTAIITQEVCGPDNDEYERPPLQAGVVELPSGGWANNTLTLNYEAAFGFYIEGPSTQILTDNNAPCVTETPQATITPEPTASETPGMNPDLTPDPTTTPNPTQSPTLTPTPGETQVPVDSGQPIVIEPPAINIAPPPTPQVQVVVLDTYLPPIYNVLENVELSPQTSLITIDGIPFPIHNHTSADGTGGVFYWDSNQTPISIYDVGTNLFGLPFGTSPTAPISVIKGGGLMVLRADGTLFLESSLSAFIHLTSASQADMGAYAVIPVSENNIVYFDDLPMGDYRMVIDLEGEEDIEVFFRVVAENQVTMLPNTGAGAAHAPVPSLVNWVWSALLIAALVVVSVACRPGQLNDRLGKQWSQTR